MSSNAYFTYSIVLGRACPWKDRVGVVFFRVDLFLLTLTKSAKQIVKGITSALNTA